MTNEQYYSLIKPYEDARRILQARIDTLSHSLYKEKGSSGAVHNTQSRIKEKESVEEKLRRLGCIDSISNARDYLKNIAGIRVICYFVEDLYNMVRVLKRQTDLVVIKERDYIACPKPNGYRSYHIVVGVPVYCLDTMEYFPVEVQFRTMAMDFWASMEHRVCYKKNPENRGHLTEEFSRFAVLLEGIEGQFERYNERK